MTQYCDRILWQWRSIVTEYCDCDVVLWRENWHNLEAVSNANTSILKSHCDMRLLWSCASNCSTSHPYYMACLYAPAKRGCIKGVRVFPVEAYRPTQHSLWWAKVSVKYKCARCSETSLATLYILFLENDCALSSQLLRGRTAQGEHDLGAPMPELVTTARGPFSEHNKGEQLAESAILMDER